MSSHSSSDVNSCSSASLCVANACSAICACSSNVEIRQGERSGFEDEVVDRALMITWSSFALAELDKILRSSSVPSDAKSTGDAGLEAVREFSRSILPSSRRT